MKNIRASILYDIKNSNRLVVKILLLISSFFLLPPEKTCRFAAYLKIKEYDSSGCMQCY